MSEELIIEHCSPTLAGIKTGSLFSVRVADEKDLIRQLRDLNRTLQRKGLKILMLQKTETYALIYLYRPERLKNDLKDPLALNILQKKGYITESPEQCIGQLAGRLKNDDVFPHEIGLFLGYPPPDVEGFIKHPRKGVKCCGFWKVYSDPETAEKTFKRFRMCTKAYHEMNKQGKSLAQLAVATG
ncbi:MAG: DUF3793 family protein [Lachnospiraceae bacterium]|nr:DUF3793 family protein [Lachnospiraceae bacterium]